MTIDPEIAAALAPMFSGHPSVSAASRANSRRPTAVRRAGRAVRASIRRRFAPHQPRHAHAIELAREGVPLNVIQRQLGHRTIGVTSIYLQGIDPGEIIDTVHSWRPPMIPANAGLALPIFEALMRYARDVLPPSKLGTSPPRPTR